MQETNQLFEWIASGYTLEVVGVIKSDDVKDDLDEETLTEEIRESALKNLEERGEVELNPMLTEEQLTSAIEAAAKASISKTINALVDKDMVQTSVRSGGEISYGLTAKGQAFSDMLEDGYIKPEDFNNNFNEGKYD